MLRLTLCLTLVLSLAACGTRLNPFNWFGNDRSERITVTEQEETPSDPRPLVDQVLSLSVEPVPQGAIVRATGLPPTQGYWQADLVEAERGDNGILYEFRLIAPLEPAAVGTQRSREVIVATELSNFELQSIRTITVTGAQNRRTVSRR
jgi:hypothetical protein